MRTSPWLGRAVSGIALLTIWALDWFLARGALAQLYSIPVALAALTGGWQGGLAASLLSSIAILLGPAEASAFQTIVSSVALIGLGLVVGLIHDRERREKSALQTTADQLSSVYERVQANFEGMKRVERLSAMGQLSAGLAHEIRNPLASIAGAASILKRKDLDPKYAKCVDIIASECARLDRLLTNFLDFARPRAPHLRTIYIESVLDNVLALASHGLKGKAVHSEKRIQPNLPPVQCDPEQLEQVLLNLMINAFEASPDQETVTLTAGAENGTVAVRVIDHGYGVAPAHVDRLFDPFFTTKEHGTGLGLPVAHQIMTQMGGTLLAQRNPGTGMTFTLVLPVKRGNE